MQDLHHQQLEKGFWGMLHHDSKRNSEEGTLFLGISTEDTRKLEQGLRRIDARSPETLPKGHEDIHVPTFWLLL